MSTGMSASRGLWSFALLVVCACGESASREPELAAPTSAEVALPSPLESVNVLASAVVRMSAEPEAQVRTLKVEVAANGTITVAGLALSLADLESHARSASSAEPELRAVIQADRTVPYGRVVEVMDALKKGGILKLAVSVAEAP